MSWTNNYSLFSEQMKIHSFIKKSKCHCYIKCPDTEIVINISIPLLFKSAHFLRHHSEGQFIKSFFFL